MQGGKKQDVEEAAEASIYCVLGAASFASQGPTNKKGGEAAEEGAAARGRVKREGGGAGGAAGCRSKSRSSSENVENFLIKVDSCMSIGTKCWPSKGASFVGSSRYATISLAIEVAPPPPPLLSPSCSLHALRHPCSHPHPQRHPDGGVTFIPHVALSSVLSLITSVCDTRLASPRLASPRLV